jgi:hypothetical protein
MPLLGLLGGAIPWRVILVAGIAAAAFGIWLTILSQAKQIGALTKDRDAAIATADQNAKIAETQRAEFNRVQSILDAAEAEKIKLRDRSTARRKVINDAPKTDDGPIAPVLRRSLDGLRFKAGESDSGTGRNPAAANSGDTVSRMPGTDATQPGRDTTGRRDGR